MYDPNDQAASAQPYESEGYSQAVQPAREVGGVERRLDELAAVCASLEAHVAQLSEVLVTVRKPLPESPTESRPDVVQSPLANALGEYVQRVYLQSERLRQLLTEIDV
jgi:hypothetical protein